MKPALKTQQKSRRASNNPVRFSGGGGCHPSFIKKRISSCFKEGIHSSLSWPLSPQLRGDACASCVPCLQRLLTGCRRLRLCHCLLLYCCLEICCQLRPARHLASLPRWLQQQASGSFGDTAAGGSLATANIPGKVMWVQHSSATACCSARQTLLCFDPPSCLVAWGVQGRLC